VGGKSSRGSPSGSGRSSNAGSFGPTRAEDGDAKASLCARLSSHQVREWRLRSLRVPVARIDSRPPERQERHPSGMEWPGRAEGTGGGCPLLRCQNREVAFRRFDDVAAELLNRREEIPVCDLLMRSIPERSGLVAARVCLGKLHVDLLLENERGPVCFGRVVPEPPEAIWGGQAFLFAVDSSYRPSRAMGARWNSLGWQWSTARRRA